MSNSRSIRPMSLLQFFWWGRARGGVLHYVPVGYHSKHDIAAGDHINL